MSLHPAKLQSSALPLLAFAFCLVAVPATLHAQTGGATCSTYPGDKMVWTSSNGQSNSHDYIDVSALAYTDICDAIGQGLVNLAGGSSNGCSTPLYHTKGVIDARGIFPSTSGGTLSCATNPWPGSTGTHNSGSVTVLLPAATIAVSSTWVLPANTRLIGEGSFYNTSTLASTTVIQATSGFSVYGNTSAMISIGYYDPAGSITVCSDCNGIALEHLTLDGNSQTGLGGIYNNSGQELNYVNDVAMIHMKGAGLTLIGQNDGGTSNPQGYAVNSGPYADIYYSGNGACVNINGTYGTRGIHGLHCVGSSGSAAVLLDGSNNTIRDVTISGYMDGILIGSQATYAQNNLLFNISADSSVTNVVHMKSSGAPTDLTLMGIKSSASSTSKYTIDDEVAGFHLNTSADGTVGLYVLGEAVSGTPGYSIFTTSKSVPAWYVGSSQPSGACTPNTVIGSLFSVTSPISGGSGSTLWGCIPTSQGNNWTGLSN